MGIVKFKNIVGVLFLAIGTASCSLDTNPTDAVEDSIVFETTGGNDKVLVGTWGSLMESFNSYANPGYSAFLRASDAMSSDVVQNTRYGFRSHYQFNALYSRGGTNTHSWVQTYKTINNVNNVIAKIDQSEGTVGDKKRIKGQALAFRGFMYLHLASTYALAIDVDPNVLVAPIYTEPTSKETEPRAQATLREIYDQVLSDLEQALMLIPVDYKRNAKYKFDHQVVLGLLSRANLYARNWEDAKKYSELLLEQLGDNGRLFMNEGEYKSGFNDVNNIEWIWGHPQTAEQSNASYSFNYLDVTSPQSYYFSFNADPYFRELFDEGDYRKKLIYWAPNPSNSKPNEGDEAYMRYAKFKFRTASIADIVLMRTSEIVLINAEAKAHLGDAGGAVERLNALKVARGAKEVTSETGQALLESIWLERRKELFGEGFGIVDIIRNQKSVERKLYPSENKIPYSYEVIDANGVVSTVTVGLNPKGHDVLVFPDKSAFVPNSKYYLYRIPEVEEIENYKLYSGK